MKKNKIIKKRTAIMSGIILPAIITLASCDGGGGSSSSSSGQTTTTPDTRPQNFSFIEMQNVETEQSVLSEVITISGINQDTTISISGGEYSIDNGDYTSDDGSISLNQQVQVRLTSADSLGETVQATLTVGGVSSTFFVTTRLNTRVVEAENAALLGNVAVFESVDASDGSVVGNILSAGEGIRIEGSQEAISLVLTYSAEMDTRLPVSINGEVRGEFNLAATGSLNEFETNSLDVSVASGDTVEIQTQVDGAVFQLDVVEFTPSPLQSVSTLANVGFEDGDGVSVSANGDVFISGGPSGVITRVTAAGEVSEFGRTDSYVADSDIDSQGNLYVAHYEGNRVLRFAPNGESTVFADQLDGPAGVFIDDEDNLFVSLYGANFSGDGATVIKITPDGTTEVVATGQGLADVIGVAVDENGNVYTANNVNGQVFNITGGNVQLLADTDVEINQIDYSRKYIYIPAGSRIVRVNVESGVTETFSGSTTSNTIDGPVSSAEFVSPTSLGFSPDGSALYIYDSETGDVRVISEDI